jgi:hypothetical protein
MMHVPPAVASWIAGLASARTAAGFTRVRLVLLARRDVGRMKLSADDSITGLLQRIGSHGRKLHDPG